MTWLKLDDKFWKHEKVLYLSHPAFRLHVSALCLCADELTDGRVSDRALRSITAMLELRAVPALLNELVENRLWDAHPRGGWRIKDFLEYNPSSHQVREKRAKDARRKAEWRESHAVTDAVTPNGRPSAPTRPDPNPYESNTGGLSSSSEEGANLVEIRRLRDSIGRSV